MKNSRRKKSNKLVKQSKKLRVTPETLRVLGAVELQNIQGGRMAYSECDMGTCNKTTTI